MKENSTLQFLRVNLHWNSDIVEICRRDTVDEQ